MKTSNVFKILRFLLLGAVLVFTTLAAYLHQVYGGAKAASIHALCPFGALESAYKLFTAGSLVSKIFQGTLVLFLITLVLAFFFRRSFCGLLCPFGALQEFFWKAGSRFFKKRPVMPAILDKPLRYLKYVVLVVTVYYAWATAGLWMAPYDPWATYGHLFSNTPLTSLESVLTESPIGLILLVVTLIGAVVYDRFFCKYLCPMGAFYGAVGKLSPFRIVRNKDKCIQCGKCNLICPVQIDVQHLEKVDSAECLDCQLCVAGCPVQGALEPTLFKRSLQPLKILVIVVVLFFGSIALAQWVGIYQMTPEKLVAAPGAGQTVSFEEIKGYMSIEEAAKMTGTELKVFYKKMELPETLPPTTLFKDIEKLVPNYDFHGMKEKNSVIQK